MSDRNPGSEPAARGFSTRAIRAASRAPRVGQTPTSVPIYQTATFASGDADELGRVSADPHAGYSYSRISNPTTSALGSAYAELAGVHTMVVHPPSTSHRQSSELELLEAGITPGLLRVSVGLEDLEDLQADFSAALADARAAGPAEAPPAPRESAPATGVG